MGEIAEKIEIPILVYVGYSTDRGDLESDMKGKYTAFMPPKEFSRSLASVDQDWSTEEKINMDNKLKGHWEDIYSKKETTH